MNSITISELFPSFVHDLNSNETITIKGGNVEQSSLGVQAEEILHGFQITDDLFDKGLGPKDFESTSIFPVISDQTNGSGSSVDPLSGISPSLLKLPMYRFLLSLKLK